MEEKNNKTITYYKISGISKGIPSGSFETFGNFNTASHFALHNKEYEEFGLWRITLELSKIVKESSQFIGCIKGGKNNTPEQERILNESLTPIKDENNETVTYYCLEGFNGKRKVDTRYFKEKETAFYCALIDKNYEKFGLFEITLELGNIVKENTKFINFIPSGKNNTPEDQACLEVLYLEELGINLEQCSKKSK